MWIIQEPKKVALWKKRHFEEKNGECAACLKYSVLIFVEKKYIQCNIWKVAVRPSYIQDARLLKVKRLSEVAYCRAAWNEAVIQWLSVIKLLRVLHSVETNLHAIDTLEAILHIHYWHSVTSWDSTGVLYWKLIPMFVMALSVRITNIETLLCQNIDSCCLHKFYYSWHIQPLLQCPFYLQFWQHCPLVPIRRSLQTAAGRVQQCRKNPVS